MIVNSNQMRAPDFDLREVILLQLETVVSGDRLLSRCGSEVDSWQRLPGGMCSPWITTMSSGHDVTEYQLDTSSSVPMYHPFYHIHSNEFYTESSSPSHHQPGCEILTNFNNLFGNPLYWTIFLLCKCIPAHIKKKIVYYESIKWELNTRLIYECRCDERLKAKTERSTRLSGYTVLCGGLEHWKVSNIWIVTQNTSRQGSTHVARQYCQDTVYYSITSSPSTHNHVLSLKIPKYLGPQNRISSVPTKMSFKTREDLDHIFHYPPPDS